MQIIPAIDLLGGQVVHARMGQRQDYQPLCSVLAEDSSATAVIAGLLRLADFDTVYIADLDAISGKGDNAALIVALRRKYPEVCFWVDAGIPTTPWNSNITTLRRVLGSENTVPVATIAALLGAIPPPVLSLDLHTQEQPLPWLHLLPHWSGEIIVMSLSHVGSSRGPDKRRLVEVQAASNSKSSLYAAGGIRNWQDIEELQQAGIAGCLLASALHNGTIDAGHLGNRSTLHKNADTTGTNDF